jgi:hypothetical protein
MYTGATLLFQGPRGGSAAKVEFTLGPEIRTIAYAPDLGAAECLRSATNS